MRETWSLRDAFVLGVIVSAVAVGVSNGWPPEAKANPGPAHVDSFSVACATTATEIVAPSGSQYAYECQNGSTTAVAVGDNDLAAPASADSPTYCATNCPSQTFGGNIRKEFCRVDSGTVTVYCRAMVASAP